MNTSREYRNTRKKKKKKTVQMHLAPQKTRVLQLQWCTDSIQYQEKEKHKISIARRKKQKYKRFMELCSSILSCLFLYIL